IVLGGRSAKDQDLGTAPAAEYDETRWKALCDNYFNWVGALDEYLSDPREGQKRRERFFADKSLAAALGPLLTRPAVDPRAIAKKPKADVQDLRDHPPPEAQTTRAGGQTLAAMDAIDRIRIGVTGDAVG